MQQMNELLPVNVARLITANTSRRGRRDTYIAPRKAASEGILKKKKKKKSMGILNFGYRTLPAWMNMEMRINNAL